MYIYMFICMYVYVSFKIEFCSVFFSYLTFSFFSFENIYLLFVQIHSIPLHTYQMTHNLYLNGKLEY